MHIVPFTENILASWDIFVEENQDSCIYHTSAWLKLMEQTMGYRQKGFVLMDGDRIVGGLPLFEVKGFKGKRLVSSPFRDRAGAIAVDGVSVAPLIEAAIDELRSGGYDHVALKNENGLPSDIVKKYSLNENRYWVTTTVDLSQGTEAIWKKLKNNAQGPVKQARNEGVTIHRGESVDDMEKFHRIFIQNRRELGIPSFSKDFFFKLWKIICLEGIGALFLAKRKKIPIAGILLLLHKDKVIDGYAASLPEHRQMRPNDLLIWNSIEWAAGEGYKTFDFGADSPSQKGLLAYKKKWAGEHVTLSHYYALNKSANADSSDSSDSKYQLARKIVSKMPMPVFKMFSSMVVRRFG